MTLEEAKEFYFAYYGQAFHMDREEPVKYRYFRQMDLGNDVQKKWDEELLDGLFLKLKTEPGRFWINHGNILRIIRRKRCDAHRQLEKLLDVMKTDLSDLFNMTLVIENMAGRNDSMNDGGVYLFCTQSDLGQKMNDVMKQMISTAPAEYEKDTRFRKAVRDYRRSYEKWAG